MDPQSEQELIAGRYRLTETVGKGAAGVVYRAWDTKLEEEIALKVLQSGGAVDANEIARFKREITIARKITHPNVIRIHDFGESGKHVFISMELLVGGTLADRMASGVPLSEGLSIAQSVCDGVNAAHVLGIVHRDLKPENILFDAYRRPKVADFGLARLTTISGRSVGFSGTPFYMSPEHANGLEITTRSDVYSLGVLFYQLFTGSLPFQADNFARLVTLHCHEMPAPPRSVAPSIPPELEKVILRALEKDPRARHATAGDLMADLQKISQPGSKEIAAVENLTMEELEAVAADPTSSRSQAVAALERLARKHMETGNLIEHATTLERLAGRMPSGGAEKLTIAGELLSGFDRNRAIRCWERAIEMEPHSIRALEHLAAAREDRQEWQSLIAVLNPLIAAYKDLQPRQAADAQFKKGTVLQKQLGLPDKAKHAFRLALVTDPDHIPSLGGLLELSEQEGDTDAVHELLGHLAELGVPEAVEKLRKQRPKTTAGGVPAAVAPPENVAAPTLRTSGTTVAKTPTRPMEPPRKLPVLPIAAGVVVLGAIVSYLVYTAILQGTVATPTPTPLAVATTAPATATATPEVTPATTATPATTVTPETTPTPSATKSAAPARTPRSTPAPARMATPTAAPATPAPTATPVHTVVAVRTPLPATPTPTAALEDPRVAPFATGNELLKAGKVNEAVRELKKAVKADDSYPDGHFFLAAAYAAQGEDAYACDELKRYVQLAPNGRYSSRARTSLANCE